MTPEDIRKDLADVLLRDKLTEAIGDGSDEKAKVNDSLTSAITMAREQELHDITMEQESQKIRTGHLKNEQTIQKIEIEKSKAVAQGLAVPQEPIQVPKPVFPSNGEVLSYMLTQKDPNISKGVLSATTQKMNELRTTGQRPVTQEALNQDDWLTKEIALTVDRIDKEKHLAYGPFGQAGGILGGLLDVISGPLDLGTEVFGGKLPAGEKLQLLNATRNSAAASTNPLVTAQMRDLFYRDKMREDQQRRLVDHGMGGTRYGISGKGDVEGAEQIISLGIEANRLIATNEKTSVDFGSESVTGIKESFDAYQNVVKLRDSLQYAETEEEVMQITQQLVQADAAMRGYIQRYYANGGTPEELKQKLTDAQLLMDKAYIEPTIQHTGDDKANQYAVRKKIVGKDLYDKFGDFYRAAVENVSLDLDEVRKRSMTPEAYAISQQIKESGEFLPTVRKMSLDFDKGEPVGVDKDKASMNSDDYARAIAAAKSGSGMRGVYSKLRFLYMQPDDISSFEKKMLSNAKDKQTEKEIRTMFKVYREHLSKVPGREK